jgi:hypothetical protein
VSGHDDQLVFAKVVDQAPYLVLLIRIESVRRFIEDQDLRVVNQRLRQADAAAKALGQRLDDLMDDRSQAQPVDDDGAPLAPKKPSTSPGATLKVKSSTASLSP